MKFRTISTYFFVVLLNPVFSQTFDVPLSAPSKERITAELIVNDLQIPWGFDFLPDGSLLVTEKSGSLFLYKNGTKGTIKGLPQVTVLGQGGLMDVKVHPDFETNHYIYFTYASSEGEGKGVNTALMRARLDGDQLTDKDVLYKASPNSKLPYHFGSRIEFDDQGHLYFSIGDRGDREANPQDLSRDGGKIYRIMEDGSIPPDNPFAKTSNAKKAVFSYGHRNPQGMVRHPVTGAIWIHEHGPRGGDELNILKKGRNYGWPVVTYGINYNGTKITDETERPHMESPIYYWTPSIAPSDMVVVHSKKYPDWKGNLLVGSLAFQYLERLVLEDHTVVHREKLLEGIGRVRSMAQGPDGYLYLGVEGKGIYKLVPN